MSEFLETLKTNLAEAQKRFTAKQQELTRLNAEFQAVVQEFNAWQTLVNVQTRKEQAESGITASGSVTLALPQSPANPSIPAPAPQTVVTPSPETNKTEIVRQLLKQHETGMTPSEIWKLVKTQIPHRPYLYSVLKRLKERGDILEKRGKYVFRFIPKSVDVKEQGVIQ
jgi:sugar-specific transcriptional regulator TrmB